MIFGDVSTLLNVPTWLLGILVVWSIVWKGLALWKSSQRKSIIWFIVLLVINTVGILEILYIYVFSEMKLDGKRRSKTSPKKRARKSPKKRTRRR